MNAIDCLGTAPSDVIALGARGPGLGGTVLLLDVGSAPADAHGEWVTAGTVALIEQLRALRALGADGIGDENPVTVLLAGATRAPVAAEALFEAARGVVQSVTLESDARHLRCNVLRAERASDKRVLTALRYLASPDGGFAIGSTLDLVGPR